MTDLIQPKTEINRLSPTESRIVYAPLERGYGHTLGSALRRLLLSSIPGVAVVEVRIKGVQHECATVAGVREDVIEILLNLKGLAIEMNHEEIGHIETLRASCQGIKELKAGDLQLPTGLTVANPDMHICSLTEADTELEMEIDVQLGKGYELVDELSKIGSQEPKSIGALSMDAVFSPVRRVSYQVEKVRVGERTDLDRLILTLNTDGTVTPENALSKAARILSDQMISLADLSGHESDQSKFDEILFESLENLGVETRVANVLRDNLQIACIGDLIQRTEVELLETPRLATKSVQALKSLLKSRDLELNTKLEHWPPADEGT
ncbi:MAG: DNA-directed RNA polymerase subunit alpha [Gammaproteobacteria bacterium]